MTQDRPKGEPSKPTSKRTVRSHQDASSAINGEARSTSRYLPPKIVCPCGTDFFADSAADLYCSEICTKDFGRKPATRPSRFSIELTPERRERWQKAADLAIPRRQRNLAPWLIPLIDKLADEIITANGERS